MKRIQQLLTVVVFLILITGAYSISIDRRLGCDEANTLYKYAISPATALFGYTTPNNHLLHSFLMWITTSVMGLSHIGIRFTAFMAGILSFAVCYRIGRKLNGHLTGIGVMTALGTSLGFIEFMIAGRGYTMAVLLTLLYIDVVFLPKRPYSRKQNYAIVAISWAILMVLPSMMLLIVPVLLWLLYQIIFGKNYKYVSQFVGVCTGGILAFLFYVPAILEGSVLGQLSSFGEPSVSHLISQWFAAYYTPVIFSIPILIAASIGLVYLIITRQHLSVVAIIILTIIIGLLVAVIQFILTDKTLYVRNYLYLVPLIAILSGVGLAISLRQFIIPIGYITVGMMLLLTLQPRPANAIDQLIVAIPQYQPDTPLLAQHACHILPAYHELTVTQKQDVVLWSSLSDADAVMIPIPVGLKISTEQALIANFRDPADFGTCTLIEDEFDWIDIHICEVIK